VATALTRSAVWSGEDVRLSDVERALRRLRDDTSGPGRSPNLRTSVMTHLAWVPPDWLDAARDTLEGMAERHPSRAVLLVPHPGDGAPRIDARAYLQTFPLPGTDRCVSTDVVELHLHGATAGEPASVVAPLLVTDLPVFLRWRGLPSWGAPELEQLVQAADRLIVDSTEWPDLPADYAGLLGVFPQVAASDIAWARTARWRSLLASLWPGIAGVRSIRVKGTAAQAHLIAGWLRSRLGHPVAVEHEPSDLLVGIDLDGEPAPFPPGHAPTPSDVLSEELERYSRDPVYEAAVAAAID
jgi:hypothetical protein